MSKDLACLVSRHGHLRRLPRRPINDMEEFCTVKEATARKIRQPLAFRKNFHSQHIGSGCFYRFPLQNYEKFCENGGFSV